MDSGNSGSLSLQSSSGGGGDDEFDSRRGGGGGDSSPLSALLRQPPPPPGPSSVALPGFGGGSFYGIQELAAPPLPDAADWSSPSCQQGVVASSSAGHPAPAQGAATPPAPAAAARGSRKRARASRRAPTTVLTTDTSNFRAMVQEFTGVPAPPSARTRSRFDVHVYPWRSAGSALAPHLLRPFAHKLHPQAFVPASSSPANKTITSPPARTTPPSATAVAAASDSYQHASTVLRMQDHSSGGDYLSFLQNPVGAQLDGNIVPRYPATSHVLHPVFDDDAAGTTTPARRLSDPAGFSSLGGHGGDELSGLVVGASRSVPIPGDGCSNTTYYSSSGAGPTPASRATTTINGSAATTATAAMRAQAGVESWICSTSE